MPIWIQKRNHLCGSFIDRKSWLKIEWFGETVPLFIFHNSSPVQGLQIWKKDAVQQHWSRVYIYKQKKKTSISKI